MKKCEVRLCYGPLRKMETVYVSNNANSEQIIAKAWRQSGLDYFNDFEKEGKILSIVLLINEE
jgi:hypothetical protein